MPANSGNHTTSDEDEGIPPSPSPPLNHQRQQQANERQDGAHQQPAVHRWTKQVDELELTRLVQVEAMQLPDLGLAVSGMAGRFPKCDHVNEFEEHLRQGRDMVNHNDEARFSCGLWGLPTRAGRLKDLSRFDNEFFGFNLEEANYIDFQLRILYEVVYESILDAGLNPANLRASNTGVFFGLHTNEFENAMADDPGFKSNGYFAQFAVKVAQYFDFRGLTVTFDAACASSFVGFHNAVQALKDGIIEQAIVCSSNIPIHPTGSFIFLQMQMLSPTGFSRFLDSRADGYVKSEACVSMVLQRKHLARRNYCSIMATMTSVDGYKKEGITFPSDKSQERLIRASKRLAGISTNHVEYLEAHGTGTPAGDPQEARAITSVYWPQLVAEQVTKTAGPLRETTKGEISAEQQATDIGRDDNTGQAHNDDEPDDGCESSISSGEQLDQPDMGGLSPSETEQQQEPQRMHSEQVPEADEPADPRVIGPLLVGSVKTNMGHSEAASGLCALAKVALMFENEIIYKGLHYQQPNKNIPALVEGKIKFVEENLPLKAKIVPVSCYGFGGSNVHVIVRANEKPTIDGLTLGHDTAGDQMDDSPGKDKRGSKKNKNKKIADDQLVRDAGFMNPRLVVMFGRSEQVLNEFFDGLLSDDFHKKNCLSDDYLALLDSINCNKIDRLMNHRGYLLVDRQSRTELARGIKRCELKPVENAPGAPDEQTNGTDGRQVHLQECKARACHLVLPGVGCQWPAMAAGLKSFSPFWSTIERLAELIDPDVDLVAILTDHDNKSGSSSAEVSMRNTFVSIVAYEIALINLLQRELQVNQLDSIVGHSLGEISCAYASGLFDEREAIRVAYEMGKTLDDNRQLCQGKMVALEMSHELASRLLAEFNNDPARGCQSTVSTLRICCINGPESVTISGATDELDKFLAHQKLTDQSVLVNDSFALHNDAIMNQPIRSKLRESLERVLFPLTDYDRTKTKWISSVVQRQQVEPRVDLSQSNLDYFIEMLCNPVDFMRSLNQLETDSIVIEAGPSNLFESQIRFMQSESTRTPPATKQRGQNKFHYVRTMCRNTKPEDQLRRLLISLGELYQAGATFNLSRLYHGRQFERLFPVRRQTPSLSSMFQWDHGAELFVPRYPIQFSKSSAKCEMPVDIVHDRDKYLAGHCVEGRILYPATGYLLLIWRVFSFTKRRIYDACFQEVEKQLVPIEFHNVRLLRAVILGNRVSQIYIHLEEATGRFEIKEGGSVVVEGFVRSPTERPDGLLYDEVRSRIQQERLELSLNSDDIYKQFRVSGYDYGETFRNVESCSFDGRYCRVKFNGHFIAFTDSILQSIFLAVAEYAPSGGLFLPTRFDYVRFQPELILKKFHQANMAFDLSEKSLNTQMKREAMTKMMQRAGALDEDRNNIVADATSGTDPRDPSGTSDDQTTGEKDQKQPECIFDTYCDPITGIIITEGIEMRGIKATPAPRRSDINEVLLESYQFVEDFEDPVQDEHLTQFRATQEPYGKVCDSMSLELLAKLAPNATDQGLMGSLVGKQAVETYKRRNLSCIHSDCQAKSMAEEKTQQTDSKQDQQQQNQEYDIRKNGTRTLISVLDQLLDAFEAGREQKPDQMIQKVRQVVQDSRLHLMRDLIQGPWTSERYLRPIIETVIENCCLKKMKLRTIEINHDDELMRAPLQTIISQVEPTLSLEYSIAHPDPNRIKGGVGGGAKDSSNPIKTHTLKQDSENGSVDLAQLFNENHLKDLDFIVYKDQSCYMDFHRQAVSLKDQPQLDLTPTITAINGALRSGGYALVLMRKRLTLAEAVLVMSLEDEVLSGLTDHRAVSAKLEQINSRLETRSRLLVDQAQQLADKMLCVARKSDDNGCLALLFRCTKDQHQPAESDQKQETQKLYNKQSAQTDGQREKPLLLRVRHDDLSWLDQLKANFHRPDADSTDSSKAPVGGETNTESSGTETAGGEAAPGRADASENPVKPEQQTGEEAPAEPRLVWLCAVASKQNPINGLVGYMQALRRELGSSKLRCLYDEHTFRQLDEPIRVEEIEQSASFRLAQERNQLWTCVDHQGRLGSFRHFTINEFMSYERCLCSNQLADAVGGEDHATSLDQGSPSDHKALGAYVNTATRGDLSSFAWYEVPLKYHQEQAALCESPDGATPATTPTTSQLVKVAYSALNFRDIMLATGRLPLDAIPIRLAMADCLLGLEFSGHELGTGRRVMGMVYGRGLATHVLCPRDTSIKLEIPDWLSLEEAATIPVVYATAVMALIYRGRMRRGERILIHAGSGGVGQAAIRLAGHFGLEIFTTVGSDEKRQFLLEEFGQYLGADHIFSSRDCHFEQAIMELTGGHGVDLVLNSLADDKLQASLRCLRPGGRFLEIGKYDMSVDSRLELNELVQNKTVHGILLDKLFDVDDIGPAFQMQLRCVLETLKQGLREGFVRPIKHKLFKRHQLEEAFRYMATGKHIGKILIEIDGQGGETAPGGPGKGLSDSLQPLRGIRCVPRFQLSGRKSYIVTGGLGGFGLELCKWLVNQGARYLIVTSRTGLRTGYQRATLRRLEQISGCKFCIVTEQLADTTSRRGAQKLCQISASLAPSHQIGGIFHLAMVLKDCLIENMSRADFELVCRPKVDTCLHLDALTRPTAADATPGSASSTADHYQVDYFVAFSSIVCGKGNTGQSNYAYANSCLERVCESRRRLGLHGLAIQWGAIGDVGIAYENLGGNDVIIGGTIPQRMPSCLATLGRLLCSPFTICLSVLPVNRSGDGQGERGNLVDAIMHVLGIKDTSKVSDDSTLGDLGLDSLMAVEIRQYIEREYDMTLNIQEIRSLTIAKIREINDKEKPTASQKQAFKASAGESTSETVGSKAGSQPRQVSSYGVKQSAGGSQPNPSDGNNQTMVSKSEQTSGTSSGKSSRSTGVHKASNKPDIDRLQNLIKERLENGAGGSSLEAMLSESQIEIIRPHLTLPEDDFCWLNYTDVTNKADLVSCCPDRRPIFFLAPIYGHFRQLEGICAKISRPCIGLNWTRKLAKVNNVQEVARTYLDLLRRVNWNMEFGQQSDEAQQAAAEQRGCAPVDLVGYSFGATVAFEMMLELHARPAMDTTTKPETNHLSAGQLILLDGSPKQIQLGSKFLSGLTRKKARGLNEIMDELLMVYVLAHTSGNKRASNQKVGLNYLALQKELKSTRVEKKIELASSRLVGWLDKQTPVGGVDQCKPRPVLSNGNSVMKISSAESDNDFGDENLQTKVAYAMEAFCRRYELIMNYQPSSACLPGDCTLIRAEKLYLNEQATRNTFDSDNCDAVPGGGFVNRSSNYSEDLDLSSVVDGKVNLYVMRGDHETFLSINYITVGNIISKLCNCDQPRLLQQTN